MTPSLIIGLALAVGAPKDDPKGGANALVGTWVEEKGVIDGKEVPADRVGTKFTFAADGKFAVKQPMRRSPEEGTYVVDPKKDPPEIDFKPSNDIKVRRGIYKVDGDTLILCFGRADGKESVRPTKFESPARSQAALFILKRVKKD